MQGYNVSVLEEIYSKNEPIKIIIFGVLINWSFYFKRIILEQGKDLKRSEVNKASNTFA